MKRQLGWVVGAGVAVFWGLAGVRPWAVDAGPDARPVVLRVTHAEMQPPTQAALREIAAAYEARHPEVAVEVTVVPRAYFGSWIKTQFVGGAPPDIIASDAALVRDEERVKHFVSLRNHGREPNPYNEGSELAGWPWSDTFLDPGARAIAVPSLDEVYGVSLALANTRLLANLDLLEHVTGARDLPMDFATLRGIGEQIERERNKREKDVHVIAGWRGTARQIFEIMFFSQTASLGLELDRSADRRGDQRMVGSDYLWGRWSLEDARVRAGLAAVAEAARLFQPGVLAAQPADGLFYFLQGRALFMPADSGEAAAIMEAAPFATAVVSMPLPTETDPELGEFVGGRSSEGTSASISLAATVRGAHPERAVDFLKFATSHAQAKRFAVRSGQLSNVVGVPARPALAGFAPQIREAPNLSFLVRLLAMPEVQRNYDVLLHRLVGPQGSVDAFLAGLIPRYRAAVASDLASALGEYDRSLMTLDSLIAAADHEGRYRPSPEAERQLATLLEKSMFGEIKRGWWSLTLRETAEAKPAP